MNAADREGHGEFPGILRDLARDDEVKVVLEMMIFPTDEMKNATKDPKAKGP